jgi:hypothetical protein
VTRPWIRAFSKVVTSTPATLAPAIVTTSALPGSGVTVAPALKPSR